MIVVPPGEVGVLTRCQRLIEGATFLRRHLGARALDQRFALGDGRLQTMLERVGIVALQQRADDAEEAIWVLEPARETDIDNPVAAPAILLQECIELLRPDRGCRRILEGLVDTARRDVGDEFLHLRPARAVGKLPHRAVRFHRSAAPASPLWRTTAGPRMSR